MTFEDGIVRLKLLGYEWAVYETRDHKEIHFVKGDRAVKLYMTSRPTSLQRRELSCFIWDVEKSYWTKERSPLDSMPLTDTERILYGKN